MARALRLEQSEKPASLGAGQYQGLIAPVRTTRLTGGSDFQLSFLQELSLFAEVCQLPPDDAETVEIQRFLSEIHLKNLPICAESNIRLW